MCEVDNKRHAAVIQSHGLTHGMWPGFVMPRFGNGNYYEKNIDGQDISEYDDKMRALYDTIKDVEEKSAPYGKGLYLVSRGKVDFAEWGRLGSGCYWTALKDAAANYSLFGATYDGVCLGTGGNYSNAWYVGRNGGVYGDYQHYDFVIAPSFNIDLSKVKIVGDEIVIKEKNEGRLENQSGPSPYRPYTIPSGNMVWILQSTGRPYR